MKPIRTKYEETKVPDSPLFKSPRSTQEIFSIESLDKSGIMKLPDKRWSKCYSLSDINFSGITEEEQKETIINFSKVLKAVPCRFSYTVANEEVDEEAFRRSILYGKAHDDYDSMRISMNDVIKERVEDKRQGLYQTIYLTLTVKGDTLSDVKETFRGIETALRSSFLSVGANGMQGSVMKTLDGDERIKTILRLTHLGLYSIPTISLDREEKERKDLINDLSPTECCFSTRDFRMNSYVGRVYYIDTYPKTLDSDIISTLSSINCTNYLSVNSELLDIGGFKQEIGRKYMAVGMKIENEKQRNRNNNDFLADASEKLLSEKEKLDKFSKELDTLDDHYFNTTALLLVMAEDTRRLSEIDEKLSNLSSIKSVEIKPCFGKQREALNSVLPLGIQEYKHVVNLSSSCLAMLMPFKTQEISDPDGIYYGINQLSGNVIMGNKKILKNHNKIFLGQSGTGKSFNAKMEMLNNFLKYPDDLEIIIDPQNEYAPLAKILGGQIISFDSAKEHYINCLDVDFSGMDYASLREVIAEKADFILTLLSSCLRRDITSEEQGIIDSVIDRVYSENYSLRMKLNGEDTHTSEYALPEYMKKEEGSLSVQSDMTPDEQMRSYSPTLQDIYQGLLEAGTKEANHLAKGMEIFVNGSLNLFNHRTNVDLKNRFLVFDISGLKENLRVTSMLIMMETVREKIRTNSAKGLWTHLYIDEFHELLSVPQVATFVLKLWKEIRKMSGIMNGITQNMSDLLNNDSGNKIQAILSNTECFTLLSQSSLDRQNLEKFLPEISPALFNYVDNAEPGTGLLKMGSVTIPFDNTMSKENPLYDLLNTDGGAYGV